MNLTYIFGWTLIIIFQVGKSKITKILNSEENSKRGVSNQKLKHIKQMDNICHIPLLVQAFSNIENLNLLILIIVIKNNMY